jgi:hypothetical protein
MKIATDKLVGPSGKRVNALAQILEQLSISEEPYYQSYRTSSREDYMLLVEHALNGRLDDVVSVGRSGIYFNQVLITPPADT